VGTTPEQRDIATKLHHSTIAVKVALAIANVISSSAIRWPEE